MQLDQQDHFKELLAPFTLQPFAANKADGGYTIVVQKHIPVNILGRVQEDAAEIGYKVHRYPGTEEQGNLFHFVCVCPGKFYVTLITKSVIDSNNIYNDLAWIATNTRPVIFTEGHHLYVVVWNDAQAQLRFGYDLIMSVECRKHLHFSDLAMHDDDNDPQPATDIAFTCPMCSKRATLPRYLVFAEDSSTLTCPHCKQSFGVRQVVW